MKSNKLTVFLICGCLLVTGCAKNSRRTYTGSGISEVSPAESGYLKTKLTLASFKRFADNVTNKMFRSPFVVNWGSKRPRLVLGRVENNTYDDNLRIEDMYDQIQEILINSGRVKVVDESAERFDYVMNVALSENRQQVYSTGEKLVSYILQFKVYDDEGELMGQWSDDLTLAKPAKSFY